MLRKITMKERDWKDREFFHKKGLKKSLSRTGYDAFRVSPRTTVKFGKKYKKIYGATVEPDYTRPLGKKNKFGYPTTHAPKVKWSPHGYTHASVKGGTRTLQDLRYYPIDLREAKYKLMLKKRKARKK